MDDVVNGLARELSDAIAAAVADHPLVEAVREKARQNGFEMKVSLEAVIGFANRVPPRQSGTAMVHWKQTTNPGTARDFDKNDKKFLRALRIAADDTADREVE